MLAHYHSAHTHTHRVLLPPAGTKAESVAFYLGGAFVGAAPQLAYRPLLEALASRGVAVVAVPYSTSFDHLRVADEVQYKFERAMGALQVRYVSVWGGGAGAQHPPSGACVAAVNTRHSRCCSVLL